MSSSAVHSDDLAAFEASRGRLEAIAYRMLGSASEAEDLVQETFLRWESADRTDIRVPEAWLTKVLTNLCLTHLGSARARRETYVGTWLPEPLLAGDPMLGPADTVEQRESVSAAMLFLMERLTPDERAVYVLREAFGYPHAEIAELLDITEAGSQQLFHRAKFNLARERARVEVDRAAADRVVAEFLAAAVSGRTGSLVQLLTTDALGAGDGGGKIPARPKPFTGAEAVAQFLRGLFRPSESKFALLGGTPDIHPAVVNGSPAVMAVVGDELVGVMVLEMTDDGIAAVLSQVNPDKLDRIRRAWAEVDHGPGLPTNWTKERPDEVG